MKKIVTLFFILSLSTLIVVEKSFSQTTVTGGATSLTIGITVTAVTPRSGDIVKKAYEITVASGEANTILLTADTNQASDNLILSSVGAAGSKYIINLNDNSGKSLLVKEISGDTTYVSMAGFLPATYFVKVLQGTKEVRSFKVVKN